MATSKSLFTSKVKGAHFIDVANTDNYQKLKNSNAQTNLRDFLMEKFMDRQWISDEELRYLTYTSQFGQKFLDKPFFQQSVTSISPGVKSEVEMIIADGILDEYRSIKDKLLASRRKFLRIKC